MKKIWHYKWFLFFGLLSVSLSAQDGNSWGQGVVLRGMAFLDVFYVYDFNHPRDTFRQSFFYNHNRHNEFNLNLGLVKFDIEHPKYRANLALQTGTYANDNFAAEPGVLKNIFEANVGISLNNVNSLWLDAGILPSHIGFESAISIDNWTLTRSILAENSPYFLTGAKVTYSSPNTKWKIAGLIVNGWQRIQRVEGNSLPSFGTQVNFNSTKTTLNWSTFIGTDDPDIQRRMRFFNNLYGQFQLTEKVGIITGLDIGIQQRIKSSSAYDKWFGAVIIGQLIHNNEKWKSAVRVEYYQDKTGIIIPSNTSSGFKTSSVSYNLDYAPLSPLMCRIEARWLKSGDEVFQSESMKKRTDFFVGASLAIKISDILNHP